MKKLLLKVMALCIAFCSVFCFLPACGEKNNNVDNKDTNTSDTEMVYSGELKYALNSEQTGYIVEDIGSFKGSELNIPATHNNLPVIKIQSYAFFGCASLKNVIIPDSVTDIEYNAFFHCSSLKSITIGKGVTSIGAVAFAFCSSLINIVIGDNVEVIGNAAFAACGRLREINVSESNSNYKSIDGNLYSKDGKTLVQYALGKTETAFTVPNSVERIGAGAFLGSINLRSIEVSESNANYKSIDGNLYSKDGKTLIQYAAGKTETVFNISDGVETIESSAIYYCSRLQSINVSESNVNYKSIDGNLYSKDGKTLIQYAIGKTATEFVIPNGVEIVKDNAFSNCEKLQSVIISDSVTNIVAWAFLDCMNLTSVTIGNSLETIDSFTFYWCKSLTNITIPSGVTTIRGYAFGGCDSLTNITIPDSVTSIEGRSFIGCGSLASVMFENISGWQVDGADIDVSDPFTVATYLKDTYCDYTLRRIINP